MEDERFRARVEALIALPPELTRGGYHGYPHPLDATLDALCALYRDASPAQRLQLLALVFPSEAPHRDAVAATGNLLTYIRRCGRRMGTLHDAEVLRQGMTAAALTGGRADARDLAVALAFLRAGATRAGISIPLALRMLEETLPEPSLADESAAARGERAVRKVILGVLCADEATITRILAYHVGTG